MTNYAIFLQNNWLRPIFYINIVDWPVRIIFISEKCDTAEKTRMLIFSRHFSDADKFTQQNFIMFFEGHELLTNHAKNLTLKEINVHNEATLKVLSFQK